MGEEMLSCHAEDFGHVIVLRMDGNLTRKTLEMAEEAWLEQLEKKPEVFALDFRRVGQIDSVSINHLFKLVRAAEAAGTKPVIIDVNEPLKKIFEVIRLDHVISFVSWKKFESDYLK